MLKQNKIDIIAGVLIFMFTLFLATAEKWSVTDLVWSLWISSLILGYAYILTAILGSLITGDSQGLTNSKVPLKNNRDGKIVLNVFLLITLLFIFGFSKIILGFFLLVVLSVVLALSPEYRQKIGLGFLPKTENFITRSFIHLPATLFLLGFFSFHFLFFHFIHSIFLNGFFPILSEGPFGKTPGENVLQFADMIKISLSRFWVFVALSAFSRFDQYVKAFRCGLKDSMFVPYKNVVRMHITIFALAFMYMVGLQSYVLYFILILYFLPVKTIIRLLKPSPDNHNTSQAVTEDGMKIAG